MFLCLTHNSDASIFADFRYVQITFDLVFLGLATIPLDVLHRSMFFMAEESMSYSSYYNIITRGV